MSRDFDVVVYGATGFVGRLTAAYLNRQAPEGTRIALAGRNRAKLEETRSRLGGNAVDWPLLVADSTDPAAVGSMAERTTAIATTVGPYLQHGMPLVAACASNGTHYADLTGEVPFVREVIDRLDDTAKRSGARLVPACGFDSIPFDMAVFALHEQVRRDGAGSMRKTRSVVTDLKGGVSGGTIASMKGIVDQAKTDKAVRRLLLDPYSLSPDRAREPDLGDEADPRSISKDPGSGRWLAPFVMSSYNTRIVRRSNALTDWAYGGEFRYQEYMGFTGGLGAAAKAAGMTAGVGLLAGGLALPPTRRLLDRVLPDPGQGPSEALQRNGFFRVEAQTTTSTGARYQCTWKATGDPGYAATAVMLGESVLALALDGDALPLAAGALTTATGIGTPLLDRLRGAGVTIDVAAAA